MLQWRVENATFFYQVSRFFRRKISPRGSVPAIEGNTKLLRTNVSFTLVLSAWCKNLILGASHYLSILVSIKYLSVIHVNSHNGMIVIQRETCYRFKIDRIGLYSCIWDVKQNLAELYSQGQEPKVAPCTASACIPLASFCYTFKFIAEFYGKPQEAREQERCWVVNLERTVLKLQWRESHVDAAVGLLNIYFEGPVRRAPKLPPRHLAQWSDMLFVTPGARVRIGQGAFLIKHAQTHPVKYQICPPQFGKAKTAL
ncbi:hypothetical protein VNO77_44219 [Canavalia gladiata]|uniref:Uncharacterized protein n=1 Tax=Canavalia gladiata TaxID=3824 RepID=A0AAN9JYJ1_CANGL